MHPATAAAPTLALVVLLGAGALLLAALAFAVTLGGRLDLTRSVLVRVPLDEAWRFVRSFPAMHSAHLRSGAPGAVEAWTLRQGDGESAGSLWRASGRWRGAPYWAEVEIVQSSPDEGLAVRLVRDSLGTHRGLRSHLGSLTLHAVGPGTTKISWSLRVRLRGTGLRAIRLFDRRRLQARLLEPSLRAIKVALERSGSPGEEAATGPAGSVPRAAGPPPSPRPGATAEKMAPPPSPPPRRPPEAGA